jgi:DNA-binding XRE family transcriptional regulator
MGWFRHGVKNENADNGPHISSGADLRAHRKARGLTQAELAKLASYG